MKIVATSNFNDETFSEYFIDDVRDPDVKENTFPVEMMTHKEQQDWCDRNNSNTGKVRYYVVEDTYPLYVWKP